MSPSLASILHEKLKDTNNHTINTQLVLYIYSTIKHVCNQLAHHIFKDKGTVQKNKTVLLDLKQLIKIFDLNQGKIITIFDLKFFF